MEELRTEVIYDTPSEPPREVAVDAPPPKFTRKGGTAFRGNTRGRLSLYEPLYVPNGVSIRFALAPHSLDGQKDFTEAKMNGWEPCTPEQVTNDYEAAVREGLIALSVYETSPEGYVQVGPHILMWRPKSEVVQEYLESVRTALNYPTPEGVRVFENREEEAEAEVVGTRKRGKKEDML
jgi:hypothetical protein